jgi:hypothetical protein
MTILNNFLIVLGTHFTVASDINWDDVIKKEANGLSDADFGEVQEVTPEYVITKKGVAMKDRFYLPRDKVVRFDGSKLHFNITKEEANQYKRD